MATEIQKQNGRERDRTIAIERATRSRQRGVHFHHHRGAMNVVRFAQRRPSTYDVLRQCCVLTIWER